jgi:uncharacterized protein YndB with AHSA1/START domain
VDPELDLTLQRIIRAPRRSVWDAWTDPRQLERWWLPAPTRCRVERLEPRRGGALVTTMSDDGTTFTTHLDACSLVVDEFDRLVFTNAIDNAWRPATGSPVPMTAEVTLLDHPDGTDYRVLVRHGDPRARVRHEDLGFEHGWGAVCDQLVELVESGVRP